MRDLGLDSFTAYRTKLESDPAEWSVLDECCHITISRFFRDRRVFDVLRTVVLPEIGAQAEREGRNARVWSAGCASGEEPYTIKIFWDAEVADVHPAVSLSITATDVDAAMLARARQGCFEPSSLHELPAPLIEQAFERRGALYCVKAKHRQGIEFIDQDLRSRMPNYLFDLILCRYVVFHVFRCTAATGNYGPYARTAAAERLLRDWDPRAIANRARAGIVHGRTADLPKESGSGRRHSLQIDLSAA